MPLGVAEKVFYSNKYATNYERLRNTEPTNTRCQGKLVPNHSD